MNFVSNMFSTLVTMPQMWSLQEMLDNAKPMLENLGGGFLVLLGVILIIYGGIMLFKAIAGGQQSGSPASLWGKVVLAFVFGGALAFGGYKLLEQVAKGGEETIKMLGGG